MVLQGSHILHGQSQIWWRMAQMQLWLQVVCQAKFWFCKHLLQLWLQVVCTMQVHVLQDADLQICIFVLAMYSSLTLCMDLYVCKCMFMQYMQVHVLYYCHYIIVCVWCMQCIIMPLYNACYDSCGCMLCMQKINNVHVCTCVCASVCVYVCIHNVHVCTCVCAWLSVCVCMSILHKSATVIVFKPKEWL